MTTQYLQQNAKGFEGDNFIAEEIKKLVAQFGIDTIFETGTYLGNTTKRLAEFVPDVISVEVDEGNYKKALENIGNDSKIALLHDNSVSALTEWLPAIDSKKILFYLDAHWQDYCPLIDELKVIAANKLKPVILIHDFKVPGRNDLGFDTYKSQPFDFAFIQSALEEIYEGYYAYHYNTQAEGAKRGVIYIYPSDKKCSTNSEIITKKQSNFIRMWNLKENNSIVVKSRGIWINRERLKDNPSLADQIMDDPDLRAKYGHNFVEVNVKAKENKPEGEVTISVNLKKKVDSVAVESPSHPLPEPVLTSNAASSGGMSLKVNEVKPQSQSQGLQESKPVIKTKEQGVKKLGASGRTKG